LQPTTHLSTRKDERLCRPGSLTYSRRFTHISSTTVPRSVLSDQQRQIGVRQIKVVTAESRSGHWTLISCRNMTQT